LFAEAAILAKTIMTDLGMVQRPVYVDTRRKEKIQITDVHGIWGQ